MSPFSYSSTPINVKASWGVYAPEEVLNLKFQLTDAIALKLKSVCTDNASVHSSYAVVTNQSRAHSWTLRFPSETLLSSLDGDTDPLELAIEVDKLRETVEEIEALAEVAITALSLTHSSIHPAWRDLLWHLRSLPPNFTLIR